MRRPVPAAEAVIEIREDRELAAPLLQRLKRLRQRRRAPGFLGKERAVDHAERIRHANQPLNRRALLRAARECFEEGKREACARASQELPAG